VLLGLEAGRTRRRGPKGKGKEIGVRSTRNNQKTEFQRGGSVVSSFKKEKQDPHGGELKSPLIRRKGLQNTKRGGVAKEDFQGIVWNPGEPPKGGVISGKWSLISRGGRKKELSLLGCVVGNECIAGKLLGGGFPGIVSRLTVAGGSGGQSYKNQGR